MEKSGKAPRYVNVATVLEGEISRLAPNSLLPTEVQLARRFGVSRITVRGALDVLERSGLVSRLRGRGTIVSRSLDQIAGCACRVPFAQFCVSVRHCTSRCRRRPRFGLRQSESHP